MGEMGFTERDLEDYLSARPRKVPVYGIGWVTEWLARQYNVPSGRIDLLGYSEHEHGLSPVIVESPGQRWGG